MKPTASARSVFLAFTAAYFLSYFFRSANAVLAPDLARAMHLGAAELGLMTSLFYAAFALVQIPLGAGLDRWGPRWVTPALMLAGVGGSLVFAAAPSFPVLALGRALIGVGMAGILMGALKAFSQWFPAERFAALSGLLTGLGSSGALVASVPLAWLNAQVGWRGVFAGGALAILAVAAAIVLWTRNAPTGGAAPKSAGGAASGFRAVFADRRFWRIAPLIFFTNGTVLAFQGLWAGPYLYDVLGLDKDLAGPVLFLVSLGVTAGFVSSGWLAARFGLARVVVVGAAVCIASQVGLALRPALPVVAGLYLLFGVFGGFSIMLLVQPRLVFPTHLTGRAVTATNLFAIGGTFLLQWWMGLIIGRFPADAAGHYPPGAYAAALLFTAAGTLAVLLWYLPMLRADGAGARPPGPPSQSA